jgi:hypothetical protein
MQCRKCGIEIADKALICYRCGTATTEAKYQPAATPGRSSSTRTLVIAVIIIALFVLLAFYLWGTVSPRASGSLPLPSVSWTMRGAETADSHAAIDSTGFDTTEAPRHRDSERTLRDSQRRVTPPLRGPAGRSATRWQLCGSVALWFEICSACAPHSGCCQPQSMGPNGVS